MSKKIYIAIIVAAVALAGWWWYNSRAQDSSYGADDLNQELQQLEVNSLDGEIQQIDKEINNL